jgi:hypothetical protein
LGLSERALIRLAGWLLLAGVVVVLVAEMLHPHTASGNHDAITFAGYAKSGAWPEIHFMEFAGGVLLLSGLWTLFRALRPTTGESGLVAQFGMAAAAISAALLAFQQAVDGVALRQAIHAWTVAGPATKATAFQDAETVRWLEWSANSYFRAMSGVTLLLLTVAVLRTAAMPRWVAAIPFLAGISYLAGSEIVGREGFTAAFGTASTPAGLLVAVLAVVVVVLGRRDRAQPTGGPAPMPAGDQH